VGLPQMRRKGAIDFGWELDQIVDIEYSRQMCCRRRLELVCTLELKISLHNKLHTLVGVEHDIDIILHKLTP
jgi:hypothetical protein